MSFKTDHYITEDGTEIWIAYSKLKYADRTINDDSVKQIIWCEEQFTHNPIRWNYYHDSFMFSNMDDYMLFLLTWDDNN